MSNPTIKIVPAGENKYKLVPSIEIVPVGESKYKLVPCSNQKDIYGCLVRLNMIANECFGSSLSIDGNIPVFNLNVYNGATPEIFKRFLEYQFAEGTFDCSLI